MADYVRMTSAEYSAIYKNLQKTLGTILSERRPDLLRVYQQAAKDAGAALKTVIAKGQSAMTTEQLRALEQMLKKSAQMVADATDDILISSLNKAGTYVGNIEKAYLSGAATEAGIKISGLDNMIYALNQSLIAATINRVYADGYTYSQKVWGQFDINGIPIGVYGDWVKKVKDFTSAGIAQGLDPAKIAKELESYVTSSGAEQFFKAGRWGKLLPGTKEYIKRLGKAGIDYRGIRLIRSELYSSLQTAAVEAGSNNPACTGYFKWILQSGREQWGCSCPDNAAGGPYTKESVPVYPHSNCYCTIEPVLIRHDDFIQSLKDYRDGKDTPMTRRIDDWKNGNGLTLAY